MVLVYQVANNNLSSAANEDYKEMLAGVAEGIGEDNHFLVYRHTRSVAPMLVEITPSGVDTLFTYDTDTYSVEISRMVEVINDAKNMPMQSRPPDSVESWIRMDSGRHDTISSQTRIRR